MPGVANSLENLEAFARGIKSFDDVLDDFARVYATKVNSNKRWAWTDFPGYESLTESQKSVIKARAKELGLIPRITYKPGTKDPDFEAAGVIYEIDGKPVIIDLPEVLWKKTDPVQFEWLDSQLPGGQRPEGYTWHHSAETGRMELVEYGIHKSTYHVGGRAPGGWAEGQR